MQGTFDDCQRLVKEAFLDASLRAKVEMSSANSIKPRPPADRRRCITTRAAALSIRARTGDKASYIIPSGNLGNAAACPVGAALGLPIDRIVLAHNANRTVPEFLETGVLQPRASVATLASAMDVGNPSNLERLRSMFPGNALAGEVTAWSIADAAIRDRIRADHAAYGMTWCPHTAVAAEVHARLPESERAGRLWVLVATAHPAKFAKSSSRWWARSRCRRTCNTFMICRPAFPRLVQH